MSQPYRAGSSICILGVSSDASVSGFATFGCFFVTITPSSDFLLFLQFYSHQYFTKSIYLHLSSPRFLLQQRCQKVSKVSYMCYIQLWCTFYSILIPFAGCEIHYKVIGRGPARLTNFTGTLVYDLKMAIETQEKLPTAASLLKLYVGKQEAKKDLDELHKVYRKGKSFDFSRLMKEYKIDVENPIFVELPSK